MATLLNPFIRAEDENGVPVSGGLLAIFEAGTTTPVTTYSDRSLSTAQPQPLVANSAGEFDQAFIAANIVKYRVSDAGGVTLYENDFVRVADRPDDPVFFDSYADLIASTDTYSTGTFVFALRENRVYEAADSGATDHDATNAGGQKFYLRPRKYNTVFDFLSSTETARAVDDVWEGGGFRYKEAASGATDHHVTNAAGVKFYVLADPSVYNVLAFGAVGDGITDDSTKVQTAVDAASANSGTVFFPRSSGYVISGVTIASNVTLEGEGHGSKLIFNSSTGSTARMLEADGLTGQQRENIVLRGLHLEGTVVADGFSEFRHLLYLYGVKDVTIEDCWFKGFQGDAIGLVWTATTEGNENVTIQNNVFDGVNKDNRNAISVIGCDKLLIDNNTFKRCTRSTMPGAIDIEPNADSTFITLRAVTISNNRFDDIGGNVAAMAMYLPVTSEDFTTHPVNVTIENNTFTDVYRGIHCTQLQSANVDDTDPYLNLQIINNKVEDASDRALWLYGINGARVERNKFTSCSNGSRIGWSASHRGCNNIAIVNNVFEENGTTDGYGIQIYQSDRVSFEGNTFIDCGLAAGGFGICVNFATSNADNIRFSDNRIITPTGRTTGALAKSGSITINFEANRLHMNDWGGFIDNATSSPRFATGNGSPEGVIYGPIGSLYVDTGGGASATLYVKESGGFNSGWVAK